ncbi:MAG: TolC family protein, partial [Bacteroidota bacterium]
KIIFLILFSVQLVQAQPVQELTQIALQQNLDLKILEQQYLAALELAPEVKQLPQPELGVGGFPLPVQTRLGPQAIRVSLMQQLPWWGILDSKEALALSKAKAAYEQIAVQALTVKYKLEQAYFELYELRAQQGLTQRNIAILKSLERVALASVESGEATTVEVLRVQLQLAEEQQALKILNRLETKPMSRINQLLNRDLNSPIAVLDSLEFAIIELDSAAIINTITANHPALKIYELQQATAQAALKVNELANKPSFSIGADYIFVNDRQDINFLDNGRDAVQLRANLTIPIYRKAYEAKKRAEQISIARLENEKSNTLQQFLATIEQTFADYESAKLRLDLYQQQKEITQSTIGVLEANYSAADTGFEELLRLEAALIAYDLKVLKVVVESWKLKSEIERLIGTNEK